jgi:hypothetical protein
MLLSSYDRLLIYTGRTDDLETKRRLISILAAISARIEDYLNRDLELTTYTEYFDVEPGVMEYFPRATPIQTITSIYADQFGQFTGTEFALSDYYIGAKGTSFVLRFPQIEARRGIRLIHVAGEAADPVTSTFTMTGVSVGGFTLGKYVVGSLSNAVGVVKASATSPLQVSTLYGIFKVGETLTEYAEEACTNATGISGTLSAITSASLSQVRPAIVQACEVECRYWDRYKFDFDAASVTKSGYTRRDRYATADSYSLQPETRALLDPYRRIIL